MAHQFNFSPGWAYPTQAARSERDYLHAALQAERYIDALRIDDAEGIHWHTNAGTEKVEFYEGSSGIAYFYLQLYRVTREERYAHVVREAARYLALHWRDAIGSTRFPLGPGGRIVSFENGLYRGVGGPALLLIEAYREFSDPRFAEGATEIIRHYESIATRDETGARWYDLPSIYFDGGIILLLIAYDRVFRDPTVRALIDDAGRRYLTHGEDDGTGGLFFNGLKGLTDATWQNVEFGSPGAALVLTRLYRHTGDAAYLDAARAALRHADSQLRPVGDGFAIPFNITPEGRPLTGEDGRPIYYIGWCNGMVGTSIGYYSAVEATGDQQYWQRIVNLADALEALGAPERESPGLWYAPYYCCGHASILQHFVSLAVANGDKRWRRLAERTAAVLLGLREPLADDAADWPIAWERIRPDVITRSPGYFDGAAGIASSLLQLYVLETRGREGFHWNRLIDDPYPERVGNR